MLTFDERLNGSPQIAQARSRLDPANAEQPLPIIFTGPPTSAEYFGQIDRFIGATLGEKAQQRYKIVIGDPAQAAREVARGVDMVVEPDHRFGHPWGTVRAVERGARPRVSSRGPASPG